jgi:biotin synthase
MPDFSLPPEGPLQLKKVEIISLLRSTSSEEINSLISYADSLRQMIMGPEIQIRGLLNISSCCARNCLYCGLRAGNPETVRYRMTPEEILDTVEQAVQAGYKTVLMQSGEDAFYTDDMITSLAEEISSRHDIALALSLGERSAEVYEKWYHAGVIRYLLKFETSSEKLYEQLHPDMHYHKRIQILKDLKGIGYQTGSGFMIGLPGQTYESLAEDILLLKELDIDMIGCGPFIANPQTPLTETTPDASRFVQPTEEMVLKVTALNRIITGDAMLPATTATETLVPQQGHVDALSAGANVVMFDITPQKYKKHYLIYPKENFTDGIKDYTALTENLVQRTGRPISQDHGHRVHRSSP